MVEGGVEMAENMGVLIRPCQGGTFNRLDNRNDKQMGIYIRNAPFINNSGSINTAFHLIRC